MALIRRTAYNLASDASASHAHQKAVEEAILIAALTGGIWPSDELFMKKVCVQIIDRITSFAIHARRAAEIYGVHGIKIENARWAQSSGPELEPDFWTIVNKILHARDIEIATCDLPPERFSVLGDRAITHIQVRSDRGDSMCFCGHGLVYAYLSQIAPTTTKEIS